MSALTLNELTGIYSTIAEACDVCHNICTEALGYTDPVSRKAACETVEMIIGGLYRLYDLLGLYYGGLNSKICDSLDTAAYQQYNNFSTDGDINGCSKFVCLAGLAAIDAWKAML